MKKLIPSILAHSTAALLLFTSSVCIAGPAWLMEETEESEYMPGVDSVPLIDLHPSYGNLLVQTGTSERSVENSGKLRLVVLADIHIHEQLLGYHRNTAVPVGEMAEKLPKGDILIIAGDLTGDGSLKEIEQFRQFIDQVSDSKKFKHMIFIPGNHDRILDQPYYCEKGYQFHNEVKDPKNELERAHKILTDHIPKNVTYLLDQSVVVEGYHFFGTPWVEGIKRWGFSVSAEELEEKWAQIPKDTDILISHMPPYLHGDFENFGIPGRAFTHTGSQSLLDRVLKIQPRVHIFGHTHEGYGATQHQNSRTLFINAATCDADYNPIQKPIVLDIPRKSESVQSLF